jgi:hypothetical protein
VDNVEELPARAREVLEGAWSPEHGCSRPNAASYPHRWLWDSCFHAIAWAAVGDDRAVTELRTTLEARFLSGFVPHMSYHEPTIARGPRDDASSLTQPAVYCHAASLLRRAGFTLGDDVVEGCRAGLEALWRLRTDQLGMLVILHPWEAGWDDSPRWDAWAARTDWERDHWTKVDLDLLAGLTYDEEGVAIDSSSFVVASAGFNAIASHAAICLAGLLGDAEWAARARDLADAVDQRCWDPGLGYWVDMVHTGNDSSSRVATLDGLLPALVTTDAEKGARALDHLEDRFLCEYGVAYVAKDEETFDPDAYWRGTAWTPLDHYAHEMAMRWGRTDLAGRIAEAAQRGAMASGMAEHRNPITGAGHGATPQTWTAAAAWFAR